MPQVPSSRGVEALDPVVQARAGQEPVAKAETSAMPRVDVDAVVEGNVAVAMAAQEDLPMYSLVRTVPHGVKGVAAVVKAEVEATLAAAVAVAAMVVATLPAHELLGFCS